MRVLLIVYDNDSFIHWFPQGLAYIAAVIKKLGHEVVIYNQDIHHYPKEHLTEFLDNNYFDMVGISFIAGYYQYKQVLSISDAINCSKQRPKWYVLGGHGPAPEPEYFLNKTGADIVVIGEGEVTIEKLLNSFQGDKDLSQVKGIAYRDGKEVKINNRRALINDIDSILWPAYELFPIEVYRLVRMAHCERSTLIMPLLSGRGCTFTCNFCYRLDKGFRPRSAKSIIEEVDYLRKAYNISYFVFSDELLMSSKSRTVEICEAFLDADLGVSWNCNGRLNYADPDTLRLMKRAGCIFINYGIEAFDDKILKNMNKALTTKQIVKGIEATLAEGISPGLNIIFGNIGENEETLQKGVDFLLKYDDGAQMRTIRPVTPYPGSPLYYHAIERGLLVDVADFYENKHLNSDLLAVNFTELSDDDFYKVLTEANLKLQKNYYARKQKMAKKQVMDLYKNRDAAFRGFRTI